jgi:hypothetical protein
MITLWGFSLGWDFLTFFCSMKFINLTLIGKRGRVIIIERTKSSKIIFSNETSIFVHPREKNDSKIIIGLASNTERTFIMGKTGQMRN